ncbi:MAG TPA: ABC transporter ATP-binding protein [Solirubrobacteraceae bacterium]|nr:ABC transporter ATP-binding protein [Solirubrobacteraceae bacterium]
MTVVLTGTDLRYAVGDRTILDGISVQASSGRVLAVRGPSGSGKSSLLTMLGGLVAPSGGTVTLDGAPVTPGSDVSLRRRFGFVLQGYGLVASLTARENVAVVLQAARVPRAQVRSRVQAVLERVGLAPVADHLVEDLSGGQQQRVAVARALVTAADVFLADEPTAELDADNRALIISLLTERAHTGAVVVIASHDPDVVDACDDVLDL